MRYIKTSGVMKWLLSIFTISAFSLIGASSHAETATATLVCDSLRFAGDVTDAGTARLDVSRYTSEINAELTPNFLGGDFLFGARAHFTNENGVEITDLRIGAPTNDVNTNGLLDFFEVALSVPSVTNLGTFNSTTITAAWNRVAGSSAGTCRLEIPNPLLPGQFLVFVHNFELIEYKGALAYTPGSNSIATTLNVAQTGAPTNTLMGPIEFVRVVGNETNELTLQTLALTNAALQPLELFSATSFLRDRTNYVGKIEFVDGELLPNGLFDFFTWSCLIQDGNDSDGDKIPNFSDDLIKRRPELMLTRTSTNLLLRISGDIGSMLQIQDLITLGATNWSNAVSVTLTNDPQIVPMSFPATPTRFWRAVAN